jgi:hypothetical protein
LLQFSKLSERRHAYAARVVLLPLSLAGRPLRELGAFRCAPSSTPTPSRSTSSPPSQPVTRGARVHHEQFGEGTTLTMEGQGPDAKLTVYFDRAGSKKFIAKYAKLTRV